MSGITIKANSSGHVSFQMGAGASVEQRCKPGKFYVYMHKDTDGVVFYVGKGTGDRAQSRDRPAEWREYVDTRSNGKVSVEIVRDGISEEDALDIEDAVMKLHGETVVNRVNPHAPYDAAKFRAYNEARVRFSDALQRATHFQRAKEFDKAVPEFESAYAHHLDIVRNADYDLGARKGLNSTAFTYHPSTALANGYSMVLAKMGRNRELIAFAERYFRDYAAPYNKLEEAFRRRGAKALNQATAEGVREP